MLNISMSLFQNFQISPVAILFFIPNQPINTDSKVKPPVPTIPPHICLSFMFIADGCTRAANQK